VNTNFNLKKKIVEGLIRGGDLTGRFKSRFLFNLFLRLFILVTALFFTLPNEIEKMGIVLAYG